MLLEEKKLNGLSIDDRMLNASEESLFPWDEFPDVKLSAVFVGELVLLLYPKLPFGVICKESLLLSRYKLSDPVTFRLPAS